MRLIDKVEDGISKKQIVISPDEVEAILFLQQKVHTIIAKTMSKLHRRLIYQSFEELDCLADEIFDDEGYGVFEAYRVEKEDRIA